MDVVRLSFTQVFTFFLVDSPGTDLFVITGANSFVTRIVCCVNRLFIPLILSSGNLQASW